LMENNRKDEEAKLPLHFFIREPPTSYTSAAKESNNFLEQTVVKLIFF
jgi:hypothetical protein